MSRKKGQRVECQMCRHPDCLEIERMSFIGQSLDDLQRDYGVPRYTIHRHMKAHVSAARKKQLESGPRSVLQLLNATRDLRNDPEDRLKALLADAYRVQAGMRERESSNLQGYVLLGRYIRELEHELEEREERKRTPAAGRTIEGTIAPEDDAQLEALVLDEFKDDPEACARLARRLRADPPPAALPAPDQGGSVVDL